MHRIPLTLRALLLVPLLAVAVDQARATMLCGTRAESCLEAAGQGWLGAAGSALLIVYAVAAGLCVARLAGGGAPPFGATRSVGGSAGAPRSILGLWVLGSAGVATVCGGQALLAGALGTGAALGGGWAGLLALCVLAGGLIALALRAAPAAAALLRALRPSVPRPRLSPSISLLAPAPRARCPLQLVSLAAAGRAPPLPLG